MVDFPRWLKLEAVSSDQEPSFGAGLESDSPNNPNRPRQENKHDAALGAKPHSASAEGVREAREPAEANLPAPVSFSAVKMLSDRYPSFVASDNNLRSKNESRYVLTVLILIIAAVLAAWAIWDQRYFHTDSDLVYYMGLSGGILMLTTLLYALRKRVGFMKKMGKMNTWYYVHLVPGVVGPVLIIFHSSFTMKSLNSSVALISMLCVIASGIFGRYIYTRIGYKVHHRLIAIRDTEERLAHSMQKYQGEEADAIEKSLMVLTVLVVNMPESLFHMPGRFFTLRAKAAKCYVDGIRHISMMLKQRAEKEDWDKLTYRAEFAKEKRILREHVNALVQIGKFHFYERLLVGWRIFHIPLIFILFISGSVHVFAVHWY